MFRASDLPNRIDRVVTPVTVEVENGYNVDTYEAVSAVDHRHYVQLGIGNYDGVTLDSDTWVRFIDPVYRDAPKGCVAYGTSDGFLCPEHGAPLDHGVEDDDVWPMFNVDQCESAAVEWCNHGAHVRDGHHFCTCCGSGMDPDEVSGPFARCWNCSTESVFVDGFGYSWTGKWSDMLDAHNVEVRKAGDPVLSNGVTVSAVEDAAGTDSRLVKLFAAWLTSDPSTVLLVLATAGYDVTVEARDAAVAWFDYESDDVDEATVTRRVRIVEVDRDHGFVVTSKR